MVTTPDLSEHVVGKAVSRLRQALPKSPRRHFTVVKKLAETMGLIEPEFEKISQNKISDETIEVVKAFYKRDDVSRQAANGKENLCHPQADIVEGKDQKQRMEKN